MGVAVGVALGNGDGAAVAVGEGIRDGVGVGVALGNGDGINRTVGVAFTRLGVTARIVGDNDGNGDDVAVMDDTDGSEVKVALGNGADAGRRVNRKTKPVNKTMATPPPQKAIHPFSGRPACSRKRLE